MWESLCTLVRTRLETVRTVSECNIYPDRSSVRLSEVVGWQEGGAEDRRRGLEEFEMCTTAKGKRASVCQGERGLFVRLDLPKEYRIQYP